MYGLVNRAIEGLVTSRHGELAWQRVRARAGVEDESFISLQDYPDELTYRLVTAASELLGAPAETVLEEFGEYWTVYTAREGYSDMFRSHGRDLREFLHRLNAMHAQVEVIYPSTRLPHFQAENLPDGTLRLRYRSRRAGLAPMVTGLVRGLGTTFGEAITVERLERREDGAPEDTFLVRWL